MGSRGPDQGVDDVYVDGEFCQSVDAYSGTLESDVLKFEKNDLRDHRVHTLRRRPKRRGIRRQRTAIRTSPTLRAVEPVVYPLEISNAMSAEYGKIQDGTKKYRAPGSWKTGRKPGRFSCDRRHSELRAPLGRVLEKHRLPQSFVCHSRILRRRRLERLSERHMIYPQSRRSISVSMMIGSDQVHPSSELTRTYGAGESRLHRADPPRHRNIPDRRWWPDRCWASLRDIDRHEKW